MSAAEAVKTTANARAPIINTGISFLILDLSLDFFLRYA
jgi:hypothetical protein